MRLIGDIHGKLHQYSEIISGTEESVQVGDFGFGFFKNNRHPDDLHKSGKHKFIRGNHDSLKVCKNRKGWIEDGHFDEKRSIMYIGGAWSIDWMHRTEGVSWWKDEELSQSELTDMYIKFTECKPRTVITHDCPEAVAYEMFIKMNPYSTQHQTRTARAFTEMFREHQPDRWFFGHWHQDRTIQMDGTEFTCLGELSYKDIDL